MRYIMNIQFGCFLRFAKRKPPFVNVCPTLISYNEAANSDNATVVLLEVDDEEEHGACT